MLCLAFGTARLCWSFGTHFDCHCIRRIHLQLLWNTTDYRSLISINDHHPFLILTSSSRLTWHWPVMHMPRCWSRSSLLSSSIVHWVPSLNLIDSIFPTSSPFTVILLLMDVSLSRATDERIGVQKTMHDTGANQETVFHFVPLDLVFNSLQFKWVSCDWWAGDFLQGWTREKCSLRTSESICLPSSYKYGSVFERLDNACHRNQA